jgi:phospholipid-binding lipoprotein MlaA
MISRRIAARLLIPLTATLLLSACATPGEYRLADRDPLEKFNRGVWGVNMAADKAIVKPVSQAYRAVAPRPVRQGVTNLFANLTEPWSFVNNVLQGKPKRAARNLGRFVVNTTIGLGGLFDQASKIGVRPANEDFGQTLATWGINGGPYLVLPLLGPSTLRDGIGTGVASFVDPVRVAVNQADVSVWYKRGYIAAQVISARSDLTESGGDTFLQTSLDPYAAARSAYLQVRRAAILNRDDNPDDNAGTGFPGEPEPAAEPAPVDDGATTPPLPGAPLPESGAPLPGDEPAAPPVTPPAAGAPLPDSAAPLPGDEPVSAEKPKP